MFKCLFLISALLLFNLSGAIGQSALCSKLDSLKKIGQIRAAKEVVFLSLSQPLLPRDNCFYKIGLSLFEEKKHFSLDSAEKIFSVWQAVSVEPCQPKAIYLELIALNYGSLTEAHFCKVFKDLREFCAPKKIPSQIKPYAILCPSISCSDIDSLFKEDRSLLSLDQAKQLSSLLAQRECTKGELYQYLQSVVLDREPSFSGFYQQALSLKAEGQIALSQHYFFKAEKLARSREQKASCYLGIAESFKLQKNYGKAKDFASFAIESDPNNTQSFLFLADLYQLAEAECHLTNDEQRRALYLLMADCYQKAGDEKTAANYRKKSNNSQRADNTTVSKSIQIGCFINEKVTIRQ